jgi:N-acetylmuramoyl-L-alanine amidase
MAQGILSAIICMTATVWLEARSEGYDAMAAVADTIMVRAARRNQSPCEVVNAQGQYATGDVNLEYMDEIERAAYDDARHVSVMAYFGYGLGIEADHFHRDDITPHWASEFTVVGRIGSHIFYDSQD